MTINKKTILVLSANPRGDLRLDEELRELRISLQRAKYRENFRLEARTAVRLSDMRQALLDEEPQIVHFCGHGEEAGIIIEDEHGREFLIDREALAGFLTIFDSIECVVLNACLTDAQANDLFQAGIE